MRRAIAAVVLALTLGACSAGPRLNGSSDGRRHSCGYVTADGVTEHLSAYAERCGRG